jgi:hypothetical protein
LNIRAARSLRTGRPRSQRFLDFTSCGRLDDSDAQKYFDSKKAEMTTRMDTLKGIRGYQVSDRQPASEVHGRLNARPNLHGEARQVDERLSESVQDVGL